MTTNNKWFQKRKKNSTAIIRNTNFEGMWPKKNYRFISTTTSTALVGYLFSSFGIVLDFKTRGLGFNSRLGWIVYFYISSLSRYSKILNWLRLICWSKNNYNQRRIQEWEVTGVLHEKAIVKVMICTHIIDW